MHNRKKHRFDLGWRSAGSFVQWTCTIVFVAASLGCSRTPPLSHGAVVENCNPGEAAARAGIEPGDVITGWLRGDRGGQINTPFDLLLVEQEEAPRGPVTLIFRRGRREFRVTPATGRWNFWTRIVLDEAIFAEFSSATQQIEVDDVDKALATLRALADQAEEEHRLLEAAWFGLHTGKILARMGREEESRTEFERGSAMITDPSLQAIFWDLTGIGLAKATRMSAAEDALLTALKLKEDIPDQPGSLAFTLYQLARSNHVRRYEAEARRSLELYQELQDEGIEIAAVLNIIAAQALRRSDLDAAEQNYRRGLAITQRLAPDSPLETHLVGGLGLVAKERGDLDAARVLFRRALETAERVAPEPVRVAYAAIWVGLVEDSLGDYEEARANYQKALDIFRAYRPGGTEVAGTLNNLGNVAINEGDLSTAERYHAEALELRIKLRPDHPDVASSLHNLGRIARKAGRWNDARQYLERAVALKRRLAPGTLWLANSLFELGEVATREEGSNVEEQCLFQEALELCRAIIPNSAEVAEILFAIGGIARREGRKAEAERIWRLAIAEIEEKQIQFDLSADELSLFGSQFYSYYGELARLLSESGRDREAYDLLESARARALRAVIAERRLVPSAVPSEMWAAHQRVIRQIEKDRGRLGRMNMAEQSEKIAQINQRLFDLEIQRGQVAAQIREVAPRFASFANPKPRGLEGVRKTLDPGTILLSYMVSEHSSLLFVVTAASEKNTPLRTVALPVGREELERRVGIFRAFIARGHEATEVEPALVVQGKKLFELLVEPALEDVAGARRVMIVPDGPLRDLPFSALVLPGDETTYFAQWKSVFFNASASVFAELKETRKQRIAGNEAVVAFGDPTYPPSSPVTQQWSLNPLVESRKEVESIAALFGSNATTYLGSQANKKQLYNLMTAPSFLHFAVHAVPNRRFPLESALFLSIPKGAEDGEDHVLRAWEVVERLRLEIDVVTLSSCGTADGRPVAGEGIIGLARAFQYAGAQTVVASQWAVSDCSTGMLMNSFYSLIRDGQNTADALQGAQRELIESPHGSEVGDSISVRHPFHWAAFQVIGDWK